MCVCVCVRMCEGMKADTEEEKEPDSENRAGTERGAAARYLAPLLRLPRSGV